MAAIKNQSIITSSNIRRSGMTNITRRSFLEMALAISATAAWGNLSPSASRVAWRERRDLFPEGVASGDPDSNSVLLWTRCPQPVRTPELKLNLEVAEDELFRRVIASQAAPISQDSDWKCRVLVGGLKPASVYWYRFSDREGTGSRICLTITSP